MTRLKNWRKPSREAVPVKKTVNKRSNLILIGLVTAVAFFTAFAITYLMVTGGRRHADVPFGDLKNSTVVNDEFLRKVLPQKPEATIFRTEYLEFFAAERPDERQVAEENKNVYVLKGDFNKNGKLEIVIAGLASKEPTKGKYSAFVLVVEEEGNKYRRLFYFPLKKSVHPDPNLEEIKNLALSSNRPREITVTFANQSGFFMNIFWDGKKYAIRDDQEGDF